MYTIRIRQYKKSRIGRTRHSLDCGDMARVFADGYKAALKDMGLPHDVFVYDREGRLYYECE